MNKQDFKYVEIIQNDPSNRGNIQLLPERIKNYNLDYNEKEIINGYHSVYMYTKDICEYKTSFGSIRGYDGSVFCNYLYWDMDNVSIEKAKSDTIELVERILIYSGNIQIFFSGNKGFHVLMFSNTLENFIESNNFNIKIKNICSKLAENIESFDSRIYDKTRIFRTPNSKHTITNYYKIPITYNELKTMSCDDIKSLATKQRKIVSISDFTEIIDSDELTKYIIKTSEENTTIKERGLFNASDLLNGIINGFEAGKRNNAYASIAGMLHNRNISKDFICGFLYNINANSKNPLSINEIDTIVNSISRYRINEDYEEKETEDIVNIEQAGDAWYKLIKTSGTCSFGERFKHISDRMKLCIPGDTIAIVANSGVGKTTLGLELGNEEAKSKGMYSLLASLEMSRAGIFFRTATIESTHLIQNDYVPSSSVADDLINNDDLKKKVYENWQNLKIIDKGGLSLDAIVEYYFKAQELTKNRISNLVIDYAQNIENAEDINYSMGMARRFKEIAKSLSTKLIVLMQCNKTIPNDYVEPCKNHIEGGGAYYQAMDYILAFWKSGDQTNKLHGKFLKDRWNGADFKFDLIRNGLKYNTENFIPDINISNGLGL